MAIINERSECRNHFDLFLCDIIMNIKIFENEKFGSIRTNDDANNPMFCLADVCKVLNLENVSRVKSRLSEKGVTLSDTLTNGGKQQLTFIDEKNLYRVIMRSDKAEAISFQDWVCDEVLPSIRKHGMYATDELVNNPDLLIQVATKLKEERAARLLAESKAQLLEQVTLEQAPKVAFSNAILASESSCLIGELAKIITQNGFEIGEKRLFKWMREKGYLGSKGERYNIPNQRYIEQGLFELKKGVRSGSNGVMHTTITPKITPKGQMYFINKFLNK